MSLSSQQGWVLPTTLFGLTLILATIRLLAIDQTAAIQILSDIRRAHTLRQHAVSEILSAGEAKPLCEERNIMLADRTVTFEVCGERKMPFMIAPAQGELAITRIDYDEIFALAVRCPSTPMNAANPFGEISTASKDCLVPASLHGGITTLENIRGDTTRVLARSAHASIIASPGRITFIGAITLESDLVIVAGGDIEIGAITAAPSQTRKVTIISALGVIRVGSVAPGVSVIAAGRATIEVPQTPQHPPFPLPPLRGHEIIGIRAVRE